MPGVSPGLVEVVRVHRCTPFNPLHVLGPDRQYTVLVLQHAVDEQDGCRTRLDDDLVDQLFNSSEKRLAQVLLLSAGYGTALDKTHRLPLLSQKTLAEMVGTTRSRVCVLLKKFRDLEFIGPGCGITVKPALLAVVLNDS
jgi:hypothetical protein